MRIALYGPYMFGLAVGLRENPSNDVRLFLDEETLPRSLLGEPEIHDPNFVCVGPWATQRAILWPSSAPVTRALAEFDVALVTELGPIFAQYTDTKFFFIPTGWDLTSGPFPIRSRSARTRGLGDLSASVIAGRLRNGIRAASGIWAAPFMPFTLAADRLGCALSADLPQPVDTTVFAPRAEPEETTDGFEGLTIFHPSRMQFTPDPFLIETGQCKRNDLLIRGFSDALGQGLDARLMLIDRASSPDQVMAKRLIDEFGMNDVVEWLGAETSAGFSWRELASLYQSSDIVVDEFGGWFGLSAVEGASCGRPVLNHVAEGVMASMYPDGHPFLQAKTAEEICDLITMLADPGRRAPIGQASREWVLKHHDRGVVARKCESMLAAHGLV